MDKNKKRLNIILLIFAAALAVTALILSLVNITYSTDVQTQKLLSSSLIRACVGAASVLAIILTGGSSLLKIKKEGLLKNILWCVPCLLMALANFPFSALISRTATIERTDLIPLLIFYCFSIALMEESVFRGIIHPLINDKFKNKKLCTVKAVIISSAIFALWHLFNLFEGASVPYTLLQVGYTFLTGCAFAATVDKTHNIWAAVLLHAIFDFGGFIVFELGSGNCWDLGFWITTCVCGIICTVHVCNYLFKEKNSPQTEGD
ncbi:MAG: CPBP family intramembrane metalloprotease [Clostridia bacterium]|nr:CPBP family intramembrane metalloprotease [Clostridia bacterium]